MIAVNTNGHFVFFFCSFNHTITNSTGRMKNNVSTFTDHLVRNSFSFGSVSKRFCMLLQDVYFFIGIFCTGLKSILKAMNDGYTHSTNKTKSATFTHLGSDVAGQESAFFGLEHHSNNIGRSFGAI